MSVSGADTNPADACVPITATPDVRLLAKPKKKKMLEHAKQARLEVTEIKKMCVIESVTHYPNPILYVSQPALLYVTAETLVNRLMWQISTATLHFNPVILHQRVMKNLFPAVVKRER